MTWFIIIMLVILVFSFVYRLSGEEERIKVFFRIYKAAKRKYPDTDEKEILGIVIEEHILPGKSIKLGKTGMKGTEYIEDVFEKELITINDIIYHAITLEFQNKYKPFEIDIEKIRRINRGKEVDIKQKLKEKINVLGQKMKL